MKRSIALILCVLLTLGSVTVLASCAQTETGLVEKSAAEAGYREVSEPVLNAVHEAHVYDAYCVNEDGAACRLCSACGDEAVMSEAELIDAWVATVPEARQNAVGYGCLDDVSLESGMDSFQKLKDAGLTGIVSGNQMYGTEYIGALLEVCNTMGFDLFLDCFGMEGEQADAAAHKLMMYEGLLDCVKGVYLRDEPWIDLFGDLQYLKDRISSTVAESENWLMGANMLPWGDQAYEPWSWFDTPGTGWNDTMELYIEMVHPDMLSFDRYPWDSNNNTANDSVQYFVANVLAEKVIADKYDIEYWTYIQTTAVGGSYAPTQEQTTLEMNLALACGVDGMFFFTAFKTSEYRGLIGRDGVTTETYDRVKNALTDINAMRAVNRMFETENFIELGSSKYLKASREFCREGVADELFVDSYGALTEISGDKAFVGCGKDENGREGFYLVNTDYTPGGLASEYTLTFAEEAPVQIWGKDGLESVATVSDITVELNPGEAKYIIVGGSLVPEI